MYIKNKINILDFVRFIRIYFIFCLIFYVLIISKYVKYYHAIESCLISYDE